MLNGFLKKNEKIQVFFIYVILILIVFFPVVLGNKSLYPYLGNGSSDYNQNASAIRYLERSGAYRDEGAAAWVEIPMVAAARLSVENGELPLWNPFNSLGMPILDNTNGSTLAPLQLFFLIDDSESMWNFMYLLRLLLAMFFTYLFISEFNISKASAIIGGIVYGLGGYSILYMNIFYFHVDAFFPLLMYASVRYQRDSKIKDWVTICVATIFMILGGNPQNLITDCILPAFWFVSVELVYGEKSIKKIVKYFLSYLSAIVFTISYWISFITLFSNSVTTYRANNGIASLKFIGILEAMFPFREILDGYSRDNMDFLPYFGMFAWITIVLFLRLKKESADFENKKIFLVFLLICLLKIIGFPLVNWVGKLPLMNSLIFTKYNAALYLVLAILCAYALDDVLSADEKKLWVRIAVVGVFGGFYFVLSEASFKIKILTLCCILIALIVFFISRHLNMLKIFTMALITIELIAYPVYFNSFRVEKSISEKEPAYVSAIKSDMDKPYERIFQTSGILMGNMSAIYGLQSVNGISATPEENYWWFMLDNVLDNKIDLQCVTAESSEYYKSSKEYLDLLNTRYILTKKEIDDESLTKIYAAEGVIVYRNENAKKRAFSVNDDKVDIVYYSNNSVKIQADMKVKGMVILSDLFYPGWNVYVDGFKKDIIRTNDILRGVEVSEGIHEIEFRYEPNYLKYSLIISSLYLLLLVIILLKIKRAESV